MEESQLAAQKAALEQLGYAVRPPGRARTSIRCLEHVPRPAGLKSATSSPGSTASRCACADDVGTIVRSEPGRHRVHVQVCTQGPRRWTEPITTAAAPDADSGKPYFGIGATTEDLKVDFPVEIKIAPGDVSGPSGGLAFTLTIIDDLTPGDLTGGKKVAVTGTIDGTAPSARSVGPAEGGRRRCHAGVPSS